MSDVVLMSLITWGGIAVAVLFIVLGVLAICWMLNAGVADLAKTKRNIIASELNQEARLRLEGKK